MSDASGAKATSFRGAIAINGKTLHVQCGDIADGGGVPIGGVADEELSSRVVDENDQAATFC